MNGVIIVAPADARWPVRAESMLADVRLFVARLYEPGLLPLLLRSGGVRAVAIDVRVLQRYGGLLRECTAADPAARIVLIHEGDPGAAVGSRPSHAWPDEPGAMLALVAGTVTPRSA